MWPSQQFPEWKSSRCLSIADQRPRCRGVSPLLLSLQRRKTSVLRFTLTANTNTCLSYGQIPGFCTQAKGFGRVNNSSLNLVFFGLGNVLSTEMVPHSTTMKEIGLTRSDIAIRIFQSKLQPIECLLLCIDIEDWNPKSARMQTTSPGARPLAFSIGTDITMMAFSLTMGLRESNTLGNCRITHGLLSLFTVLTSAVLWRTIDVVQTWIISWIGTSKSENIATQTCNRTFPNILKFLDHWSARRFISSCVGLTKQASVPARWV